MREKAAEREGGGGLAQEARRRLASVLAREFSKKVRAFVLGSGLWLGGRNRLGLVSGLHVQARVEIRVKVR